MLDSKPGTQRDRVPQLSTFAIQVASAVAERRYRYVTEADLQRILTGVLATDFPGTFVREHRLDSDSRIDFFAPTRGIGIECKATYGTAGSTKAVIAQLARYADRPEIHELLFVAGARQTLAVLPNVLCGKPILGILIRGTFG